jgi:hypothetical protein
MVTASQESGVRLLRASSSGLRVGALRVVALLGRELHMAGFADAA